MRNKKTLKLFLLKGFVFIGTITITDICIGSLLKRYYNNQSYGDDYNTKFVIEKASPQTLIIGSSRAVNIFDPCIFKDELNTTTFNAGRLGQSIFYHYAILKAVLKRHRPQLVLLSVDRRDFTVDKSDYDKLSDLLPFYKTHPELRPILNLRGPFEKIKMLSSIYPYNSMLLSIVRGHLSNKSGQSFRGYVPLAKTITKPLLKVNYDEYAQLDSVKINIYRALIADCKRVGVKLFIACPPYMVESTGIDQSIVTAKQIAFENKVPFFDASEGTEYISRMEYFADFRHLNETGSMLFSRETAQRIKQILNNPN